MDRADSPSDLVQFHTLQSRLKECFFHAASNPGGGFWFADFDHRTLIFLGLDLEYDCRWQHSQCEYQETNTKQVMSKDIGDG